MTENENLSTDLDIREESLQDYQDELEKFRLTVFKGYGMTEFQDETKLMAARANGIYDKIEHFINEVKSDKDLDNDVKERLANQAAEILIVMQGHLKKDDLKPIERLDEDLQRDDIEDYQERLKKFASFKDQFLAYDSKNVKRYKSQADIFIKKIENLKMEISTDFLDTEPKELLLKEADEIIQAIKTKLEEVVVPAAETETDKPVEVELTEAQKATIDAWLKDYRLNEYGNTIEDQLVYISEGPLWDPEKGIKRDRYQYLLGKFPDLLNLINKREPAFINGTLRWPNSNPRPGFDSEGKKISKLENLSLAELVEQERNRLLGVLGKPTGRVEKNKGEENFAKKQTLVTKEEHSFETKATGDEGSGLLRDRDHAELELDQLERVQKGPAKSIDNGKKRLEKIDKQIRELSSSLQELEKWEDKEIQIKLTKDLRNLSELISQLTVTEQYVVDKGLTQAKDNLDYVELLKRKEELEDQLYRLFPIDLIEVMKLMTTGKSLEEAIKQRFGEEKDWDTANYHLQTKTKVKFIKAILEKKEGSSREKIETIVDEVKPLLNAPESSRSLGRDQGGPDEQFNYNVGDSDPKENEDGLYDEGMIPP
ncbi:hypothetical protein GYA19_00240, partial [Candidatus Beckwithbacteria bacterium]|nr:hypothetical protein [Candidatus Beckwithbacteria bacterium]